MEKMRSNTLQKYTNLKIEVTFQDLEKQIKVSKNSCGILKVAESTLKRMQGKWQSAAMLRWFKFEADSQEGVGCILSDTKKVQCLNLGNSIIHLKEAKYVMVCSYTIGDLLDVKAFNASSIGHMLDAYLIDQIGLAALKKTGDFIAKCAEDKARSLGWGVSPFLTPGSVHGWDLTEQSKLFSLLPLKDINITLGGNMMLSPMKSICALVGIGPGYKSSIVENMCGICTKKANCQICRYN